MSFYTVCIFWPLILDLAPDYRFMIVAVTIVLFLLVAFIFSFLALHFKRNRSYLRDKSHMQQVFEQEILKAQLEIQENTLSNISQEIHDNIGQTLILAKLNITTVDRSDQTQLDEKLD